MNMIFGWRPHKFDMLKLNRIHGQFTISSRLAMFRPSWSPQPPFSCFSLEIAGGSTIRSRVTYGASSWNPIFELSFGWERRATRLPSHGRRKHNWRCSLFTGLIGEISRFGAPNAFRISRPQNSSSNTICDVRSPLILSRENDYRFGASLFVRTNPIDEVAEMKWIFFWSIYWCYRFDGPDSNAGLVRCLTAAVLGAIFPQPEHVLFSVRSSCRGE